MREYLPRSITIAERYYKPPRFVSFHLHDASSKKCRRIKFCGGSIFLLPRVTNARGSTPFRRDDAELSCPGRNILFVIVIRLSDLAARDRQNYPINHYYSEAFFSGSRKIRRNDPGIPAHPSRGKTFGQCALSLFRMAHAMRDHSVYDTYGV